MEALSGSTAKIFAAKSHHTNNEQNPNSVMPRSAKFSSTNCSCYFSINLPRLNSSPATQATHCLPFSNSEGEFESTGNKKSVSVKFQMEKECQFGDHLLMVGDDPILGSWNPSNAKPFYWSEGHMWTLSLEMPVEKSIQYKILLKKSSGTILWQPGPDRSFEPWETRNVIVVTEEWENAEAQRISEEQEIADENEELIDKVLVDPSVLSIPMNLEDENVLTEEHPQTVNRNTSVTKKSKNAGRNAQKREVKTSKSSEKGVKVDKSLAEKEDEDEDEEEGKLVSYDEGEVLVPGLTVTTSGEALVEEHRKPVFADNSRGSDAPRNQNSPDLPY